MDKYSYLIILFLGIFLIALMSLFYILADIGDALGMRKLINIGMISTIISVIPCLIMGIMERGKERFLSTGFLGMGVMNTFLFFGFVLLGAN